MADVKNPDKEMLKETLDIWTRLSERFPDYTEFRERKEIVDEALASLS